MARKMRVFCCKSCGRVVKLLNGDAGAPECCAAPMVLKECCVVYTRGEKILFDCKKED